MRSAASAVCGTPIYLDLTHTSLASLARARLARTYMHARISLRCARYGRDKAALGVCGARRVRDRSTRAAGPRPWASSFEFALGYFSCVCVLRVHLVRRVPHCGFGLRILSVN